MQRFNVAAYLRLSKEEFSNEKESNSITNQKLIVDNYLKEHNEYKLVDYYIDYYNIHYLKKVKMI